MFCVEIAHVFEVYKGRSAHVGLCLYLFNFPESKEVCTFSYLCGCKLKSALCWFYYVKGQFFFHITYVTLVVGKYQGLVKFNEFTHYALKCVWPALKGRNPL